MINMTYRISFLFLICTFCGALLAQENPRQEATEVWLGATLKMKLHKKFRLDLEQQLRLEDHESGFDQTFTELGLRYKINDNFNIKGQYRYAFTDDEHNEGRWSIDLDYTYDIKNLPLDIAYRFRFQDEKVDWTGEKKTYIRQRITLDYNLSKLMDPAFEYEWFYKFNQDNEFRRSRYTLSLQWKLNKRSELVTFARLEDEYNVNRPERIYIMGLAYSYDLDFRKKK